MPYHASQMYSRNIQSLLGLMLTKEGKLNLDMNDDVIKGTVITKDGSVVHEATRKLVEPGVAEPLRKTVPAGGSA
jgi:NAD(P) transhydrogenase subunit alpha